jgi:hypothetical protein
VARGGRLRGACSQLAAYTVQTGVQKQEICSTVLSEVDSVHGGGSFPFLHGGRVFLITLRGAGVALRVNKIGFACKGNRLLQRGPSYIGRCTVAVD